MNSKLIIFDCDGTLVNSELIACEVFPKFWKKFGIDLSIKEFKEIFIGTGNNHPAKVDVYSRMSAQDKLEAEKNFKEALEERLTPVLGIVELLEDLHSSGYRMCVASNSPLPHVKLSLDKCGLTHFFNDHLYSAQMVEKPKPAPDLLNLILKDFNCSAEDAIVIEDSPSGVLAAKNAQIEVVGFFGASHFVETLTARLLSAEPDYSCASAAELKEILRK